MVGSLFISKKRCADKYQYCLNGLQQNFQIPVLIISKHITGRKRWERNTDEDKAGYLDLTYNIFSGR
jgi:hypothetical protein